MIDITLWFVDYPGDRVYYARARGVTQAGFSQSEVIGLLIERLADLPSSGVVILPRSAESVRKGVPVDAR